MGRDVADVRHAIEIALELTEKYAGEVYASAAGHLEFAYSASAGGALQKAFHAAPGEAFGFLSRGTGSDRARDGGCSDEDICS